ncbi:MAG: SusC/RagA family TonB-linked outer membrane protein [Bacteroidales bacterium]|nr:SusC/RagA family TonB-linked outer membrane protein [Bacteroidales bacterium]
MLITKFTTRPWRVWCVLLSMMVFVHTLNAQRTVTGTVRDRQGETLPGVSIQIAGTGAGVTTDFSGRYSISAPGDATLVFSFIGMRTSRQEVGSRAVIDVVLEDEATHMQEVVVTGYREISAESYTGAGTVMSSATITARPVGSIDEVLRGNAPGIIASTSGQPGEMAEIRLRGVGSMNAGNQPLYVVDGVVWDMDNQSGSAASAANPLTTLNPMDIANITILRDAASAALYGSRGANGVIVITTKTGQAGEKLNFTFGTQVGVSAMLIRPHLVDGPEFAELWTEAQFHLQVRNQITRITGNENPSRSDLADELWKLYGDKDGYFLGGLNYNQIMKLARQDFNNRYAIPDGQGGYHDYDFFGVDRKKLPSTSWFDEISRIAPFTQSDLSMQGGSGNMRYLASLGYFNQQGTIINSQLQRYSMRLRLSSESNRQRINWSLNNALTHTLQSGPPTSGSSFNMPQYTATMVPSVVPVKLEDGTYNYNFPDNLIFSNNPVAAANLNRNDRPQTRVFLQGWVQVNNIVDGLKFRSTNTLNYNLTRRHDYANSAFGDGAAVGGQLLQRDAHSRRYTSTNLFTYDKNWGGVHRLNAIVGAEFENWDNKFNQIVVGNFPTDNHHWGSMGSEVIDWSGGGAGFSQLGLLATVDYTYQSRYILTGSYRRDGSSRFHPDHRWGDFWSVAGAWRISNESFFKDLVPEKLLSNMRLRFSYGTSGTLPSQYYHWREAYNNTGYMGQPGVLQTYRHNEYLSWEGNRIINIGADMRLFDGRIRFSAEYFDRRSKDLLHDVPVSMASGFENMLMNTDAGIQNNGIEFELSGNAFEKGKHRLDFNFNLATLKAVYYGLDAVEDDSYSRQRIENGFSVNTWRLRRWGGVDPTSGEILYLWHLTSGETGYRPGTSASSAAGYTPWFMDWQGIPKVTGGLTLTYSYGPFTLSALMSYAWGHYIFDRLGANIISSDGSFNNYSIEKGQLDRWTPDNPNSANPMRLHGLVATSGYDRYLYKGDYLKVSSIRLAYEIPKRATEKMKMSNAVVFAQTQNPFIFTKVPGYDPELSIDGYRQPFNYPSPTSFLMGLTLNF